MEPITHLLTGACLSRAGFNRKTALATATMTLAAEAPDLDILGQFGGPSFGFAHHRGFTHSFLGLLLVAGAVVGLMYLVWRVRGRKTKNGATPRWCLLFLFAYLAGLSHILLDFTNNYGVRPLLPFSGKWFSWDIVFIFEPLLFVLLLGGLVVPGFLALINEEIGARRQGLRGRLAATLALVGVLALWGVRDYEHRRAIHALQARAYENVDALRVSAYPAWWNPFQWFGVVETEHFFATMEVDSLTPDVDPQGRMAIRYKPEETPVTLAARKSYMGGVYMDWAKYPITETEQLESGGYLVRFRDLRFGYVGLGGRSPLQAGVELDRNLNVIREFMGSSSKTVPVTEKPANR